MSKKQEADMRQLFSVVNILTLINYDYLFDLHIKCK